MRKSLAVRRKLSVFSYTFILSCVVLVTVLFVKELNLTSDFEEILYQRDIESNVVQENKYYIKKIKDEYGITIVYGDSAKNFMPQVDANSQNDINIANNNIKAIYQSLKKYPSDVFSIFKEDKYSLYIILVSNFNDSNIAIASKNQLNQYRIYLSNNENFERSFHHEFFHVLEYYMAQNVKYLYHSWNSYNPYGFKYEDNISKLTEDFVYDKLATDEQNKKAYFLSKYSKTAEKEDRAELFAELMILSKYENFLGRGTKIREKIDYMINEIHENISISDFYFSNYLN